MGVPITFLKKKIKSDQHDERHFFASSIFWSELKQAKLRLTITSRVKILKRSTFSIDVLLLCTPHHLVQAHIQINWTFAEMEI